MRKNRRNKAFQSFIKSSTYPQNAIAALLVIVAVTIFGVVLLNKSNAAVKPLTPGTSWQWQLTGTLNTTILDGVSNSKKMYDIDLFDNSASTIAGLKAKGITVICYMSAGTYEDWRPDASSFPSSVKGSGNGWPGENWLDIRNWSVLGPIMSARMDLAVSKGCDGIEPDNVDGYTNSTGFPLTAANQITYNNNIATTAHAKGLSVGLKNDVDQLSQLVNSFDWALNEQCYEFSECGGYSVFISQNKAVFGVEYTGNTSTFCPQANAANYDWLKKDLDLTATRTACREGNGSSTPLPTVNFSANPTSINSGSSSTLSWSTADATSCTASGGWTGTKATSGSQSLSPTSTTTYTLTCTGAGGSTNRSVTVTVSTTSPPTATVSANPASIGSGGSSTITWSSTNATSCTASGGWSGTKATSGTQSVTPTATTTYTITCTGTGGTSSPSSATVTVSAAKVGDLNNDGRVDIFDLSILLTHYGT